MALNITFGAVLRINSKESGNCFEGLDKNLNFESKTSEIDSKI